jgi:hypothetical protein
LTERPRYDKTEESCTGLCLIKKMEVLDAKIDKKKAKKSNKKVAKVKVSEAPKPKKVSAPCTGMCAVMRQKDWIVDIIRYVMV